MKIMLRGVAAGLVVCVAYSSPVCAGGAVGEAPYEIAEKLYARGRIQTALKYYRKALRQDPAHPGALERVETIEAQRRTLADKTTQLVERAKILARKGRYRQAEDVLVKAAKGDPENAELHFQLGEIYLRLEQYDKATAEYGKAKALF